MKKFTDPELRDSFYATAHDYSALLDEPKSIKRPPSLSHIKLYNKTTKSIENMPIQGNFLLKIHFHFHLIIIFFLLFFIFFFIF